MAMTIVKALCGLAFFLYGMKLMGDGLQGAAGPKLKSILNAITKNRFISFLTGLFITAVIQSSSTMTAMLVGLVNAGLMNFSQTVGAIMGAKVGTTVTGLIVALNIDQVSYAVIIGGVVLMYIAKKDTYKHVSHIVIGLGVLFFGMGLMKSELKPLTHEPFVQNMFEQAKNPFVGILVGFVATAIFQSSSAVTGVLITLGAINMLDLHSAIFIVYGSNIGACTTPLIASIGASKSAKKVTVVCFQFSIIGAIIFSLITYFMPGYVTWIQSLFKEDVGKQIMISHVLYNVGTAMVLLPLAQYLIKMADFMIKENDDEKSDDQKLLQHLDDRFLNPPSIAVDAAYNEVTRMSKIALKNYRLSANMFLNMDAKKLEKIKKNEGTINYLNHKITEFLVKISSFDLNEEERTEIGALYHIVNDIERVGDHAENIMEFGEEYIENPQLLSKVAIEEVKEVCDEVEHILIKSIELLEKKSFSQSEIEYIFEKEERVDELVLKYKNNHVARLNKHICTPESGVMFTTMLNDLERISDHAKNIASSLKFEEDKSEHLTPVTVGA